MAYPLRDETVRVGLLGCGHVGSALVRLIDEHADVIESRAGVRIEVASVAVRNLARERDVPLPAGRVTRGAPEGVFRPGIHVLLGGVRGVATSPPPITTAAHS